MQSTPGRFHALYGAAKASELAGDRENARKYYAELLKVAEKGDAGRPELEAAKKFVSDAQVAKN